MKPTTKPINISCRVCQNTDLDSIVAIENLAYESPWSKLKFNDSLNNPNILASVILLDQKIVGYLFALNSLEFVDILNICIHPKYQHQGLGKRLYTDFIQKVKKPQQVRYF